ncbi:unnamed protein product [Arabidopsis halleri]
MTIPCVVLRYRFKCPSIRGFLGCCNSFQFIVSTGKSLYEEEDNKNHAIRKRTDPVIVCFDVRYEDISFIKAPRAVVVWECESIFIDYRGKLASITVDAYCPSFKFWFMDT